MVWGWNSDRRAKARYERLFREAQRRFHLEMRAIFARHAADGHLQSGKTIKAVVRALDEATAAAISDALAGIAAVTSHAGLKRKHLLDQLSISLTNHGAVIEQAAREAIERIGLGADFRHAVPLIEAASTRHVERITDFADGWAAPTAKPWKDRNPIMFAATVAVISGALGLAIGWAGKVLVVD